MPKSRAHRLLQEGPEEILEIADPRAGLRAFLVIDSTRRGPAFGGIRIKAYASEREALLDALDLAATMTLKAAAAGLPCGGGKIVVMATRSLRRGAVMNRIAEALENLDGRFFAGRDYGMSHDDLVRLRRRTRHAAVDPIRVEADAWPLPAGFGRSGVLALSDAVARGTLAAIRAALAHAAARTSSSRGWHGGIRDAVRGEARGSGSRRRSSKGEFVSRASAMARRTAGSRATTVDLEGTTIAVQGLGAVGVALVARLVDAGARVIAADPDARAARAGEKAGARIVPPSRILSTAADVVVPAALGRMMDRSAAARCRARIVCGPANNVFSDDTAERAFVERGIVVVPDVLVSAGALIASALCHLEGRTDLAPAVDRIGVRAASVLREAEAKDLLPSEAARRFALRRLHSS